MGETGKALVEGDVNGVVFIGSVSNGRRVVEASAKNLIPVVMELGGKDPLIVCDDAHLDQALHGALGGTFINCGQNCVSSERILVMEGIADAFEAKVQAYVSEFRQGGAPVRSASAIAAASTSMTPVLSTTSTTACGAATILRTSNPAVCWATGRVNRSSSTG